MINCRYFEYSTAKLDEIRKIDESLSFEYFVLNQEESIKSIEDIDMDSSLLVKLLLDNRLKHENKNKLFNVFGFLLSFKAGSKSNNSNTRPIATKIF